MKKNILLLSLFLFVSSFFLPGPAFAHFAATDGTITVELHVDPNDDPIPGQQAFLYFLFKFTDTSKQFHLTDCTCTVAIYEQSKQIYQQQLLAKNNPHLSVWGANMPFNFPTRDVYTITLKGSPKTPNAFKPFFLSWNFRVNGYPEPDQSTVPQSDPSFSYFAIGFLSIVVGTGVVLFFAFYLLNKNELDKEKSS